MQEGYQPFFFFSVDTSKLCLINLLNNNIHWVTKWKSFHHFIIVLNFLDLVIQTLFIILNILYKIWFRRIYERWTTPKPKNKISVLTPCTVHLPIWMIKILIYFGVVASAVAKDKVSFCSCPTIGQITRKKKSIGRIPHPPRSFFPEKRRRWKL